MFELFGLIQERIAASPLVKATRIYNAQLANLPTEQVVKYPCVYVEIAGVEAQTRPGLEIQDMSAILRLRVVNNSPKQNQESERIYTLKDQVHQYVNGFSGGGKFQPLVRTGEILSYNHSNLYEYQLEYALRWKEVTPPVVPADVAVAAEFNLSVELDIDNPVLRTGDNGGYSFEH